MKNQTITAIEGLLAGHCTDDEAVTGCTAILCPEGFTPGVYVPGFAPGSRETELLRPESRVEEVHGILLTGGSAFGLAAADGVVRWLRERGYGLPTAYAIVPIVAGAVIYDLDMNRQPGILPDAAMGYAACQAASAEPLAQGSLGAGTGARLGRLFNLTKDNRRSSKSGLGTALVERGGILVGAVVVVNALGNLHDPENGVFISGGKDAHGHPLGHEEMLAILAGETIPQSNTVLVAVAANVPLSKVQASRLARMAGAGLARCIRPAHLTFDGDVVFALAAKKPLPAGVGSWSENLLGAMGAEAVVKAAVNAVKFVN